MIFVIGGIGAGKRKFVQQHFGYKADDFTDCLDNKGSVFYNLHGQNCEDVEFMLEKLNGKAVIICNELGCGLVPMEKEQRVHREAVGRLSIEIGKKADEVYRVYAGIGTRIK